MADFLRPSETACRCRCGFDITPEARVLFNRIREQFGKALIVSGPARCPKHNKAVGGAENSRHLKGDALDISTAGMSDLDKAKLVGIAVAVGAKGIGVSKLFLHIDFRPSPNTVYWDYGGAV